MLWYHIHNGLLWLIQVQSSDFKVSRIFVGSIKNLVTIAIGQVLVFSFNFVDDWAGFEFA